MAINEKIVTGKKLRRFVNGAWERISFWHKASDCEMKNGNNLEEEIQDIRGLIENNKNANEHLKKQVLVYNGDTDYYQGFFNGQWKNIVYAGLKFDGYLIKDGVINNNFCGGLCFNANLPLAQKYIFESSNIPYINSIVMTNVMNSAGSEKELNYLHCYTYSHTNTTTQAPASGSIFSMLPINLDRYNSVTIDYRSMNKTVEKGNQSICFGFTKELSNLWFSYISSHVQGIKEYMVTFNNWASYLTEGYTEDKTIQLDLTHLSGYGYFTISLLNSSNRSLIADIYNIKFE